MLKGQLIAEVCLCLHHMLQIKYKINVKQNEKGFWISVSLISRKRDNCGICNLTSVVKSSLWIILRRLAAWKKYLNLGLYIYTCSHLEINVLHLKCLQNKDQEDRHYAEGFRREKTFHLHLPLQKWVFWNIRLWLRIVQSFAESFITVFTFFSSSSRQ